MATLLEQEQKRLQRAENAEKAEKAAALKRRKQTLQARKAKDAIRLERRNLLGEAFMQAFEAEKLTPQHLKIVNDVLLMLPEDHRGKNWGVMDAFLLPAKAPAKAAPANQEVGIHPTPAVEAA